MMKAEPILNIIKTGLEFIEMSFETEDWRSVIPSSPGWYFIETDTPLDILLDVGPPLGQRHYDIPKKVKESLSLRRYDACILPSNNSFYIVYSGEAKNLKSRAREHISGHPKTGCLALINYKSLHSYKWKFYFVLCPIYKDPNESKNIRTLGEQAWRAKYGWPVLCGK